MKKTLILPLLVAMTSPAFAVDIYFMETGEEYEVGHVLSSASPTHNGGSYNVETWDQRGGGAPSPATTVIEDPTGAGKGNVFHYQTKIPNSWHYQNDISFNVQTQQQFTTFEFYLVDIGGSSSFNGPKFQIQGDRTNFDDGARAVRFSPEHTPNGGDFVYFGETSGTVVLDDLVRENWYRLDSTVYGATKTWDVEITDLSDGSVNQSWSGLEWDGAGPSALGGLNWGTNSSNNNHSVYLNNIAAGSEYFKVPEPASMALLGFGGLLMLRRSRKA